MRRMPKMKRRHFLATLGLGAGAPLLSPLFSSILRAQENNTSLPRRFVIFVEGNGVEANAVVSPNVWSAIESAGGSKKRYAYTGYNHESALEIEGAALGDAKSLSSLKGDANNVSLENKSALIMGLSSKIAGGGHSTGHGALSSTRMRKVGPGGPTIDAVLSTAPELEGLTPFRAIRLGVETGGASVVYGTCAFDTGKPAPTIINPTAAFNVLFGSVSTGSGQKVFQEKSALLDFTRADINRALNALPGSSPERQKLEDYLASVEALITRQSVIESMSEQLAAVKPSEPSEATHYASADPFERMRAHTDLAIASLLGGLTQVVVITMGANGSHGFSMEYPSLTSRYPGGKVLAGHDLRHAAEHGDAASQDVLHGVTDAYVTEMARMARALDAVPEYGQSGSMLDHTVMLYMSSNGEKHHSKAEEWPMLLMGGSALGVRTDGRAVVFPRVGKDRHRQVSNIFQTLGHVAGLDLDEFGEEGTKRVEPGPLSELWNA